jgi:hypothetical protein
MRSTILNFESRTVESTPSQGFELSRCATSVTIGMSFSRKTRSGHDRRMTDPISTSVTFDRNGMHRLRPCSEQGMPHFIRMMSFVMPAMPVNPSSAAMTPQPTPGPIGDLWTCQRMSRSSSTAVRGARNESTLRTARFCSLYTAET